jgi:membrane protein YdbS with pleckstrin-like domain
MSDTNNSTSSGGIGFAGLLAILFIALKLTGAIAWSWWWVLSPLWISAGVGLIMLLVIVVVAVVKS